MKRKTSKVSSLGKARRKTGKQGGDGGYSGAPPKRTQPSVGAGALRRHTITPALLRALVLAHPFKALAAGIFLGCP